MIITESITIKGTAFTKTYSDEDFFISREGIEYEEAYDPADSGRTYTETDHKIHEDDEYLDKLIAEVKGNE